MQEKFYELPVAVLGFGRAGRAATDFLLRQGAALTVYDLQAPEKALRAVYERRGVRFFVGAFPQHFSQRLLVRSPVIRPDHPAIAASLATGAVLTSETELFLEHTRARIIGVTGSDGKTTTANLIALLLRGAGHTVYLGGNNGTPLLPQTEQMTTEDFAVLELSSFQLMTVTKSPEVAVITNITPNHLDWHRDMAEYTSAKRRIFAYGAKRLVINASLKDRFADMTMPTFVFAATANAFTVADGETVHCYSVPEAFCLEGRHNRENLAAAYAAVRDAVPFHTVSDALAGFRGVPHRLQYVDTVAGVRYYNSSIDTSPTRTAAALAALDAGPIVLAGGKGKGLSFAPLKEAFGTYARAAVLYGQAAKEIEDAVAGVLPTHRFDSFRAAFYAAARMAREGDTVLLSPACTAFDQFRDFEERGEMFCALVRELKEQQ